MAFTLGDFTARLSTGSAGTAGNTASSTPAASLGGYISTTAYPTGGPFDTISDAENRGSVTDYRCFFVVNSTATPAANVRVWVVTQVPNGATASFAVDPTPASALGSTTAQALVIATETTAPSGISGWSAPTGDATGLLLGDIPAGYCRAIWVKRTAENTAALTGDGYKLRVTCDQV